MILMNLLLVVSYSQLSGKHQNLKHPRKLETDNRETILIGFDNYTRTPLPNSNSVLTFYTYFLLKNWNSTQINDYLNNLNNISITSNITTAYNKTIVPYDNKDFDCSFYEEPIYEDEDEDVIYYSYSHYCLLDNKRYDKSYKSKCWIKYECKFNAYGYDEIKKIYLTTNFTDKIELDDSSVTRVSTSAESLKKDITSLKNITIIDKKNFDILEKATFVNEGSNSFKIKGEVLYKDYNSENIQLIVSQNGYQKIIPCVGKQAKDNEDDIDYYYLESKGGNYLTNIDFNYAIANFTKNDKALLLDFKKGEDSIIKETPVFKKSKGLSKGVICAIAIPTILLTLGVGALVFFLSRRPLPPPQPIKNVMNNTVGIASSGVVVNQ
jgi:hypothetical protein